MSAAGEGYLPLVRLDILGAPGEQYMYLPFFIVDGQQHRRWCQIIIGDALFGAAGEDFF